MAETSDYNGELTELIRDAIGEVFGGRTERRLREIVLPTGKAVVVMTLGVQFSGGDSLIARGLALYDDRLVGEQHIDPFEDFPTPEDGNPHYHDEYNCFYFDALPNGRIISGRGGGLAECTLPDLQAAAHSVFLGLTAAAAPDDLLGEPAPNDFVPSARFLHDPTTGGLLFDDPALRLALDDRLGLS